MQKLPLGMHRIQSVGACPSFHIPVFLYLCTTDGKIWIIDDINMRYVTNMIALAHGPWSIKPFPCIGTHMPDGSIVVDDVAHIDGHKEDRMRNDASFASEVTNRLMSL